ncbi:sn-glycerol-3-phosphate transporter [Aliidiomarina halalkaliphila]|uniref:sn-glycerol-3-phosphate transporter n=2 Tax=Aliidiomarina halalkaliphila TaxID=2593535 RepID=A0A552X6F1_9GAMM|nr:sn-glycerol-3-phosphate transporter [Aliidiomarina halalkaliphila]
MAGTARADDDPSTIASTNGEEFRFQLHTSVFTTHFNPKPEHNNTQNLIGLEWYGDGFEPNYFHAFHDHMGNARPLAGAAWFRNSFDQKSIYLYGGVRQDFIRYNEIQTYAKITAGLIHGYRGEYRDKIPFNQFGIAPAIIPMVGASYGWGVAEITFFGFSGVMLTLGATF